MLRNELVAHRVLNMQEVTQYLHLSTDEVEKLVQQREIPCEQRGGRQVFRRRDIDAWASQRVLTLPEQRLEGYHRATSTGIMEFAHQQAIIPTLVRVAGIEPALRSRTKASILRDLVALAERLDLLNDPRELLTSLEERERLGSTALAGGVALLHPSVHDPYRCADSFIVLGRSIQAVPFSAPDGTMTDLFFLICCQNDRLHLHVLARLCMMCHHTNLLLSLREAADADEMYRCLLEGEQDVLQQM